MKTVFSVLCAIGLAVLLPSCDGDSDSSSGGSGDFPTVSYSYSTTTELITCYGANSNVYTGGKQVCVWNCAFYNSTVPRYVKLTFDHALVCEDTGVDATTGETTQTCSNQMALVGQNVGNCVQ